MDRWRGRIAVVTGASAGIGAAVVYQLLDAGVHVVALARRKEKILSAVEEARREAKDRGRASLGTAPSPGQLHTLKCDVSNEEDVRAAFKWVKENLNTLHILVNNAGVTAKPSLLESTTSDWQRILDTNVLGLSICTREALQLMKATEVDDGHIIHIGSVAGHDSNKMPTIYMYTASKNAVRVLTEGLRKELVAAKSKIRVTEVSPGVVQTEFIKGKEEIARKLFIAAGSQAQSLDPYALVPHLKPEDVADAVLYAIASPAHVQIHEIMIKPIGEAF